MIDRRPDVSLRSALEVGLVCVVLVAGYSAYGAAFAAVGDDDSQFDRDLKLGADNVTAGDWTAETGIQFREVAERDGLDYEADAEEATAMGMITDSGAYATDFDRDGWTDVLVTGGIGSTLYENVGGEFEPSGALPDPDRNIDSALFFDYDGDGWEDLLVLSPFEAPLLYENRNGTFARSGVELNASLTSFPVGAAAADYNGDGCMDLFVIQYGDWSEDHPEGMRDYSVALGEDNGNPNRLLRGTCGDGFENVSGEAGVVGNRWSLATSFTDLTGDGLPDIHVANDFNYDVLYVNDGDGTFTRTRLPVATNRNGMSSEVTDLTGDGRLDVFTTNIFFPGGLDKSLFPSVGLRAYGNNLLAAQQNGSLRPAAGELGVKRGGWGWAAAAADFENDGDSDLFHATLAVQFEQPHKPLSEVQIEQIHDAYPFFRYPQLFEQRGDAYVSVEPTAAGLKRSGGRGVVQFDYDRDGDVDLLVADAAGPFRLYENVGATGSALEVVVESGPEGVALGGTRVDVSSGRHSQVAAYDSKSDFLSQDSRVLHFGVGNRSVVDLSVTWPDGTELGVENVEAGQRIVVSPSGVVNRTAFAPAG